MPNWGSNKILNIKKYLSKNGARVLSQLVEEEKAAN